MWLERLLEGNATVDRWLGLATFDLLVGRGLILWRLLALLRSWPEVIDHHRKVVIELGRLLSISLAYKIVC